MSVAHEPVAMKIYLLAEEDLSALRSTWNPPRVYLSKQPGRANMSGQIRETGWLGTTGHSHRLALGAVDTDTPDWSDRLRQLLPDDFQLDQAALLAWLQDDTVTTPFHLNPVHVRCTEGLTWNEESDDEDTCDNQTQLEVSRMKGITYQKFTGEPIASKFEAWKRLKEGNGVRVLGEYGFMDIVANRSISPYIVGTTPFDNAGIVLNYAAGVVSTERSE